MKTYISLKMIIEDSYMYLHTSLKFEMTKLYINAYKFY